jgi:hypothetical protein
VRGLSVGQPLRELQHRHHRQPRLATPPDAPAPGTAPQTESRRRPARAHPASASPDSPSGTPHAPGARSPPGSPPVPPHATTQTHPQKHDDGLHNPNGVVQAVVTQAPDLPTASRTSWGLRRPTALPSPLTSNAPADPPKDTRRLHSIGHPVSIGRNWCRRPEISLPLK